jgi:hypothetical protein
MGASRGEERVRRGVRQGWRTIRIVKSYLNISGDDTRTSAGKRKRSVRKAAVDERLTLHEEDAGGPPD